MILNINGNLLDFPKKIDVICHGCNTRNIFGAGLAKQIKDRFPRAYDIDTQSANSKSNNLGELSFCRVKVEKHDKWIFNLYQQDSIGRQKRGANISYKAFRESMTKMRKICETMDMVVGIPHKIGCGLAGGDWRVVRGIIEDIWKDYKQTVYIVKYDEQKNK